MTRLLYLIVLLYPFIDLQIIWGDFNAPYVDIIALIVFIIWIVQLIKNKDFKKQYFPGIIFFLLFLASSLLSLINTPDFWFSFKYILRPLAFFYLMFVLLPYNLIKNKHILENILKILYGLGIFTSLLGFFSLFVVPAPDILSRRVVPFSIFGLNFLGTNHNQIAEILIVTIPIGFFLYYLSKQNLSRKLILFGNVFMIAICLLTFSRSAWIVLVLELLILVLIQYRYKFKKIIKPTAIISLCLLPLAIYMFVFSGTAQVSSSNVNRTMLMEIAIELWQDHPVIGHGVGTFQDFVSKDYFYILEFGSPLDAHGFIWKLLPESGFLGLTTFLLLVGYILYKIIKAYQANQSNKYWGYLLVTFLIISLGALAFEFFQTSYFVSRLWLPLGIGLAISKLSYDQ